MPHKNKPKQKAQAKKPSKANQMVYSTLAKIDAKRKK